ncbi:MULTISPECIES: fatty acyl-AMP ligase [Cyanophyceae]|uniref:fatty acyl-AMP ligase n=1 Tax=Cyanophyceae TaxID=3028117 RepID=UPI0016853015|nr:MULTISPECIES: fatty acyl-AMP ligase [Cyanophyceae]MBD1915169.1 fatty acyl-AMP ligase [Phormidium sp. FACHB-77]MBD2028443.1 fatty acyl-AMP ligase [Phormidium sp. FACHB-322]MBD2051851.1 fatty acyl-AMP ligase [Leptolyngbya sp. FACHB-60]
MTACFTRSITPEQNPEQNRDQTALTLIDLLLERASHQPNRLAYTFLQDGETETGRFTYHALDQQARAIAAKLQSLNMAGSRALLIYPPGLDFIAAFFGCLYAGVIAVPAYPPRRNQTMSRLQAILRSSQATLALTTATLGASIRERFAEETDLTHLQWLATDTIDNQLAPFWQPPLISPDSLAFLQYTSGSTGAPKGVMISHRNVIHNSALIHQCLGDTPESLGVSWLPPYHDMGLIGGILQPLYVGAPMILMPPMAFLQKPIRWLQAISKFQATTSGGPNFAFDLCMRKVKPEQLATLDLSRWQVAFTGAEPIRAHTLEQFANTFAPCGFRKTALHPCYGMAETTLIVSGGTQGTAPTLHPVNAAALENNRIQVEPEKAETRTLVGCGQSLQGLQVVIVDPETLTPCPANQVGEVWVAGQSVAQGYWDQPAQTAEIFQAHLSDTGEGPFLRTGDLGFLLDGELFITGRIKDLMIIRGQNHYPQDIEMTVENSHSALRPAAGAAFTIDVKDKEQLVIVQEIERSYLRKLDVQEVVTNIRQAVASQHGLQVYAMSLVKTGSIPKTSSGKIQRHACRSQFLNGTLSVIEDWSENPQNKAKFLNLKAEVETLLQELGCKN